MAEQFGWARGHYQRDAGEMPHTQTASYRVANLIDRGLLDMRAGKTFLNKSGLVDFEFQLTWAADHDMSDEMLEQHLNQAEGFAVFVHGWTGNYRIWERLPSMLVERNPRLVSMSIDHNGFGHSRFKENLPPVENCNPPAAMRTLQAFVDLMKLRRQPGNPKPKVVNFIGHSMGGATLFYLNPVLWNYGEMTRYACAPALLLEDEVHQRFYTTLGTGISLLERLPMLEFVERAVKPRMIETLCNGASEFVKRVHTRQYQETPRGITGATFRAMGLLRDDEIAHDFETFRVILGHKDNLVDLNSMIDLLGHLEFPVPHMRVVPGSHYMFSVAESVESAERGVEGVYQHSQSRECVLLDILQLHEQAYDMQKTGRIYGRGHPSR